MEEKRGTLGKERMRETAADANGDLERRPEEDGALQTRNKIEMRSMILL